VNLEQTCEVIFQLYKSSPTGGVVWTKEIFQKYELAYKAKDRLTNEEIIINPTYGDPKLNPIVNDCNSYEQALGLLKYKSKYAVPVFTYLKQNGYNGEYFWSEISSACNIPSEDSEDTMIILSHQEYIYKTGSTDHDDLIKANPENITAALHGLEKKTSPFVQYKQHFEVGGDFTAGDIAQGSTTKKKIKNEESAETKELAKKGFKLNKKMLTWTIVGILLATLIGILALCKKG